MRSFLNKYEAVLKIIFFFITMEKKKLIEECLDYIKVLAHGLEDEGVLHPKAWDYIDELETRYWNGEV